MKDVVIYGAGCVGRLTEQIISDINDEARQYRVLGYIDDDTSKHKKDVFGLEVLGGLSWLKGRAEICLALGFSDPHQKYNAVGRIKDSGHSKIATLVHPSAWVSKRVDVGQGSIIYPGVHIDVDVNIGCFVLINKLCTVGHDTVISDFVTVSPGVNLGGTNTIGEGVEFGINSCSIQGIRFGSWSVIGAGATIINDVSAKTVVAGNPGKVLRKRT